ncbi:MAG: helix-turn-helix domain-containing protein [Actinomycetota bacterium]
MVLRADAQRNLERVLDAATEVFAASGPAASVDEIARRAGVGHATVFRRFATKDDLMYAVIERRIAEIRDIVEAELQAPDPGEAFFRATEKIAALHMDAPGLHECVHHCGKPGATELDVLAEELIARAQRAGGLRRDVKAGDISTLMKSALQSAPPDSWRRYLAVVLDGLRTR